jgi:hypothetical protein
MEARFDKASLVADSGHNRCMPDTELTCVFLIGAIETLIESTPGSRFGEPYDRNEVGNSDSRIESRRPMLGFLMEPHHLIDHFRRFLELKAAEPTRQDMLYL